MTKPIPEIKPFAWLTAGGEVTRSFKYAMEHLTGPNSAMPMPLFRIAQFVEHYELFDRPLDEHDGHVEGVIFNRALADLKKSNEIVAAFNAEIAEQKRLEEKYKTSDPSKTPPPGYRKLPAGHRCRCPNLWTDGTDHWCCSKSGTRLADVPGGVEAQDDATSIRRRSFNRPKDEPTICAVTGKAYPNPLIPGGSVEEDDDL